MRALVCAVVVACCGLSLPGVATASKPDPCANHMCTKYMQGTWNCHKSKTYQRVARCYIRRAARHYGQSPSQAIATAHCESRFQWWLNGYFEGMYQFLWSTWASTPYGRDVAPGRGYRSRFSPYSPRYASLAAMWMWKHGRRGEWPVCG